MPFFDSKGQRNHGDAATPGFKGGYVIDREGNKHLAGKVQSIPDTTRPTDPPDPEDEESRRQEIQRRELRELGIAKAIEDYLKANGPSRISDIANRATLKVGGTDVPLNQSPAVEKWKKNIGATKPLIDVLRRFREKFEVYDEDKGGYARLAGDETTARDAKKVRLRDIAELARDVLDGMPRDSNGWARLKDLLAGMRARRKTLDDDLKAELGKDCTLRSEVALLRAI